MVWTSKLRTTLCLVVLVLLSACSVSYKFNGASIDYSKTKTIQIAEFPIRSSYVWGPMGPLFNNELKDHFASHTRLIQVKQNKKHSEDFERQFTATATYETTQSLNSVQEELVTQMTKDLCDQIFNATVANW